MRQVTVPQMATLVRRQFEHNPARPLFFWGPPGVGKTHIGIALGTGERENRTWMWAAGRTAE